MKGHGVFEGVAGAYPRALYRSMGFDDDDFEKPLIGIVNSWSQVDPGHFHLRTLAELRLTFLIAISHCEYRTKKSPGGWRNGSHVCRRRRADFSACIAASYNKPTMERC